MNMAIVGYGNVGKSSLGYYFANKKFSKDIEPTEH
jgi:GTPase SAR1 family protein